jgi:hypothetical protein
MASCFSCLFLQPLNTLNTGISIEHPWPQTFLLQVTEEGVEKAWT